METFNEIFKNTSEDVKEATQENALKMMSWLFRDGGEGINFPEYWRLIKELVYMSYEQGLAEASPEMYCQKYRELTLISGDSDYSDIKKKLFQEISN